MSSVSSDAVTEVGKSQEVINEFWESLITKKPTKVTKIFPSSLYANLLPPPRKPGTVTGKNAQESYEAAAADCRARVKRIVRECHRTNEKFTDPDFDIDNRSKNCLEGLKYWYDESSSGPSSSISAAQLGNALATLVQSDILMQNSAPLDMIGAAKLLTSDDSSSDWTPSPSSIHRIDWIFENPQFELDGFDSSDLVQGANGDCWFIAAVATICSNQDLIRRVCVERDEECGVYGFVFYRDGDWIWTVVDDNLYLTHSDFDAFGDIHDPTGDKERRYKKNNQTGSEALYFAKCADDNETWLPLLEKAYAKVHGDYNAISGGFSGEAVEDLTGGVTSKILTDRVLSRSRLWKELLQANQQFLFSASSPGSYGGDSHARRGLALGHAYSVIKAVDVEGEDGKNHQLVLIRNPWGKRANASMGEWTGAWSDGSSEWTPYWMKKLDHRFGDDGVFWMSYEDLLKRFNLLDRTRIFDKNWTVVQQWTSQSVAWVTGYLNTKFVVEIKQSGPTVFVLSQLDDRYFRGLEGKYSFDLHFILQEQNAKQGDHILRARGAWFGNRSISAEVDLEAGIYEVLPKIEASRDDDNPDVHEVVTKVAEKNPQKLRQIGLNYDIANAKGVVEPSEEEKKAKAEKKKEAAEKKKKEEEEAEKEKTEFEAWKQEGKAEYEAWKKEKKEKEEKKNKEESEKESDEDESSEGEHKHKKKNKKNKKKARKQKKKAKHEEASEDESEEEEPEVKHERNKHKTAKHEGKNYEKGAPIGGEDHEESTDDGDEEHETGAAVEVPEGGEEAEAEGTQEAQAEQRAEEADGDDDDDDDDDEDEEEGDAQEDEDTVKPWNAVCVLGLRVYSKDPEVSIKLVKPKDDEEAAILDVGGETPAGATM